MKHVRFFQEFWGAITIAKTIPSTLLRGSIENLSRNDNAFPAILRRYVKRFFARNIHLISKNRLLAIYNRRTIMRKYIFRENIYFKYIFDLLAASPLSQEVKTVIKDKKVKMLYRVKFANKSQILASQKRRSNNKFFYVN